MCVCVCVNTYRVRKADWHVTEGMGRQREEEESVCVNTHRVKEADWHVTEGKGRQWEEEESVCVVRLRKGDRRTKRAKAPRRRTQSPTQVDYFLTATKPKHTNTSTVPRQLKHTHTHVSLSLFHSLSLRLYLPLPPLTPCRMHARFVLYSPTSHLLWRSLTWRLSHSPPSPPPPESCTARSWPPLLNHHFKSKAIDAYISSFPSVIRNIVKLPSLPSLISFNTYLLCFCSPFLYAIFFFF